MKRTLKHIVIHCAATPDDKIFKAADIDQMHKVRGFKRQSQFLRSHSPELKYIGYHYVIERDGAIVAGRHLEEVGAHVQGSNSTSIGICLIGTKRFTKAQWASLSALMFKLCSTIKGKYPESVELLLLAFKEIGITLLGHRDFSPDLNGDGKITRNEFIKDCPNFDVKLWLHKGMIPLEENVYGL